MTEIYFVKSFEDDFTTKTVIGKKKINCQTINQILKTNTIAPNTISFGRKRRLACTLLAKEYTKTYRSQGIIFQTIQSPDYIAPFDIILLTNADKIVVQYYRIQNNLHTYYNHNLIPGADKFIFKNFQEMIKKYKKPIDTWKQINKFRVKNGFRELPKSKFKLVEYNEAIFYTIVKIKPIAIFGYKQIAKDIAIKHHLPHYASAKLFYDKIITKK